MYNIDLYSYWKKPFYFGKNFSIHPLDEPGKEKYYSDQSHCVHYLKRTDPFVFKSICGTDYASLVREQEDTIKIMNKLKEKGFATKGNETEQGQSVTQSQVIQQNNINDDTLQQGKHINHYVTEKEEEKNNTVIRGKRTNLSMDNYDNPELTWNQPNNFRSFSCKHRFRPYNKPRGFKETYGYDNKTTFKNNGEKYLYSIRSMKKNNFGDNGGYVKPKRKYDGFTYNEGVEIPRTRPNTASFQYYNDKMSQTLNCANKSNNSKVAMNEEEMKTNLMNQTSSNFLKKYHLPDVVKIANSRQVITRQKIGLSKELGEKYNPYAFIPISKNRTGRNYVGDLFKH